MPVAPGTIQFAAEFSDTMPESVKDMLRTIVGVVILVFTIVDIVLMIVVYVAILATSYQFNVNIVRTGGRRGTDAAKTTYADIEPVTPTSPGTAVILSPISESLFMVVNDTTNHAYINNKY